MDDKRPSNSSTDSEANSCEDVCIAGGSVGLASLMRRESDSGEEVQEEGAATTAASPVSLESHMSPNTRRARLHADKFVATVRQKLAAMMALSRQPRRLDAESLARRLAEIRRESHRQRNSCPLDPSSRWVDLTIRIRRDAGDARGRLGRRPVGAGKSRPAVATPAKRGGGSNKTTKKAASGKGDEDKDLNARTLQFRIRASRTCQLRQAVLPVLNRIGVWRENRFYRLTTGDFDEDGAKERQLGPMSTVDSLVAKGIKDIFLNF